MSEKAIPMTKVEARNRWAQDAYTVSSGMVRCIGKYNEIIRQIINRGEMKGQDERRLVKAVEDIEDQADRFGVILLGPDISQEERDARA